MRSGDCNNVPKASCHAKRSLTGTVTHPPASAFSRSTGRSLQTQGNPIQRASRSGNPQPSAIVGNANSRDSRYNRRSVVSSGESK